jgi:RNA polymerase sigma-70 factor (family 1)
MQAQVYRMESDEELLIKGFQGGDPQALKRIFLLYWNTQVFFARRFIPESDISEDIVSEVFLKLWDRRTGFSSLPAIRSWLYLAVRNACVDHLRKNKRVRGYHKEIAYLEKDDIMEDASLNEVVRAELVAKVMEGIDLLPNQYKKVMHLATQGMGTEEIAREMNLSPKIVRNYKARAINILKKDLLDKSPFLALFTLLFSK